MFSYRHAFHAGNHADVLKHMVLIAIMRHLTQKDTALTVFDTHAGAGLYRLDGDYAETSGEAAEGFLRLIAAKPLAGGLAPVIQDYLDLVASFNTAGSHKVYPGSPFIIQRLLREDGFEGLKKFLPPPARRALVLSDPSYEIKTDYARVLAMVADSLTRFATGTYAVWYPLIPRPEAHDVPRKLKTLAVKAGKAWLNASLTVKSSKLTANDAGEVIRPGLPASGMFVINPPHTLKAALGLALPQLAKLLGQDKHATSTLESAA